MTRFIKQTLSKLAASLLLPAFVGAQENNFSQDFSTYMTEVRNLNKFLSQMPQAKSILTADGLKAQREMMLSFAQGKTVLQPTNETISGPNGSINIRIFNPGQAKAVVLDIHGGAWCVGEAKADDILNDEMARVCQVAVVSVDYRLAPEFPFPACIIDCRAAAKWLVANAKSKFGTDKIFISGASAGGHLAALTSIYIRDSLKAIDKVKGLNLVYGCYDLGQSPSLRQRTDSTLVLDKKSIDEVYQLVFSKFTDEQLRNPAYSPLYANLKGLPPALFTVGTADPLLDDSQFMESRWRNAGNLTFLAVYPEGPHGFNYLPTKMGKLANEKMYEWIKRLCQ